MKKESRVLRPTDAFKQSVGVSTRARQLPSNKARAASSLKMGEHFEERSLESLEVTGKIHDLLEKLVQYPNGRDPRKDFVLSKGVYECAASCSANFMRLRQPVRNEAELRYSIADPIINLLCDYCNLTVRLSFVVICQVYLLFVLGCSRRVHSRECSRRSSDRFE